MSASMPTVSVPFRCSSNDAQAEPAVYAFTAAFSESFCEGYQPPAGSPSGDVRLTAVWIPNRGFIDTTGQSLPNASAPRAAAILP